MKRILASAGIMAFGMTMAQAQTPQPADWTILTLTANANKPAAVTWDRIGGHDWCGIVALSEPGPGIIWVRDGRRRHAISTGRRDRYP